jgi:hypothetical protein
VRGASARPPPTKLWPGYRRATAHLTAAHLTAAHLTAHLTAAHLTAAHRTGGAPDERPLRECAAPRAGTSYFRAKLPLIDGAVLGKELTLRFEASQERRAAPQYMPNPLYMPVSAVGATSVSLRMETSQYGHDGLRDSAHSSRKTLTSGPASAPGSRKSLTSLPDSGLADSGDSTASSRHVSRNTSAKSLNSGCSSSSSPAASFNTPPSDRAARARAPNGVHVAVTTPSAIATPPPMEADGSDDIVSSTLTMVRNSFRRHSARHSARNSFSGGAGAGLEPRNSHSSGAGAGLEPRNSHSSGAGAGLEPRNSHSSGEGPRFEQRASSFPVSSCYSLGAGAASFTPPARRSQSQRVLTPARESDEARQQHVDAMLAQMHSLYLLRRWIRRREQQREQQSQRELSLRGTSPQPSVRAAAGTPTASAREEGAAAAAQPGTAATVAALAGEVSAAAVQPAMVNVELRRG